MTIQSMASHAVAKATLPGTPKRAGSRAPYGLTMWFTVSVPDLDSGTGARSLGHWSGCSGIGVQLTPDGPVAEGGNHGAPRYLPGEITYPKVTLERAMTTDGTRRVRAWLERLAGQWAAGERQMIGPQRPVVIELLSGLGAGDAVIDRWELTDAIPVSWTVAPFTTGSGGVATEKLELVHSGFLKPAEPVPGAQLQLVEKQNPQARLDFFGNPAEISLSKSREAETKRATVSTTTVVVDPNSLAVSLSKLRLEGTEAIRRAIPLLRRWVELEAPANAAAVAPKAAEGTDPPECTLCHQKNPSPEQETAAGSPRVLRMVWGDGRGVLPQEVLLKAFDVAYNRFTPGGEPSRATVTLTLQEHQAPIAIGAHRNAVPGAV